MDSISTSYDEKVTRVRPLGPQREVDNMKNKTGGSGGGGGGGAAARKKGGGGGGGGGKGKMTFEEKQTVSHDAPST